MTPANLPCHALSFFELPDEQRAWLYEDSKAGSLLRVSWTLPLQLFSQVDRIYKIGSLIWDDETSFL